MYGRGYRRMYRAEIRVSGELTALTVPKYRMDQIYQTEQKERHEKMEEISEGLSTETGKEIFAESKEELQKRINTYKRGYAQIDLDAIIHNMKEMQKHTSGWGTRFIGVVKADGYGHGSVPIAHALEPLDLMYGFAVATAEEAYILRQAGITKPILVLGYTFPYSYEMLAEEHISTAVFRYDSLPELSEAAGRCGEPIHVHIKVDTGMGRIGITPDEEGLKFVEQLMNTENVMIEGIFTHFAKADEKDNSHAKGQAAKFDSFVRMIEEKLGLKIPVVHCSNSAGALNNVLENADMAGIARVGITMYGLYPSEEVDWKADIRPALSLYSHIVYIKTIHAGQSVSYGGTFTADKDTRVATVPLGYADGYPRSLSGKGYVLIHGKKAPVLGRVCMDQFMVDVSHIPEAKEDDRVTLLGYDGEEHISAELLGGLSGRFNYELVCDLDKRIPRVYLKDGSPVYVKDYYDDYK